MRAASRFSSVCPATCSALTLHCTGRRADEQAQQEAQRHSRVRTVDGSGRAYGTGKRKNSVARVWIWVSQSFPISCSVD